MKSRKTLSRLAALFLSVLLLAALAVAPASAVDGASEPQQGVVYEDPAATAEIDLTKTIVKPANTYLPDAEFVFSIRPDSGNTAAGLAQMGADATIVSTAGETTEEERSATSVTVDDTAAIVLNTAGLSQPGVYAYIVTEAAGTYEHGGVQQEGWAEQRLRLDVTVIRNEAGELVIYGYALYDPDAPGVKLTGFTNRYLTDGSQDRTYTFQLNKNVAGNAVTTAEDQAHFNFNVLVTNDTNGSAVKQYYLQVTHRNPGEAGHTTAYTVVEGTSCAISVAEADEVVLYGLTRNDVVNVTEVGYDGATPAGACDWDTFLVTNTANSADGEQTGTGDLTVAADSAANTVTFTNTHEASIPTGVIRGVAPYVLMVAVAAGAWVVFLGRRHKED